MTQEEYEREQREAEQLVREINALIAENDVLEAEISMGLQNLSILCGSVVTLGNNIEPDFSLASDEIGVNAEKIRMVTNALTELSDRYFVFKTLSTASKNLAQYNDEYYTHFSYYNKLRRITLGFIIGLEGHFVSDEAMRKSVEKAYLQNTEYWLAYAITAVMLWASDEQSAAQRALEKALFINRYKASLFFMLTNLRFNRVDAARKWFVEYMGRVEANRLGDEWQYLLQAYLTGAFGQDDAFCEAVESCFKTMLAQTETSTVGFGKKFSDGALRFAEYDLHTTDQSFFYLKECCRDYGTLLDLLSRAEKNARIAAYYDELYHREENDDDTLAQRIEDVLYSLISAYDDDEQEVMDKIRYNEAIISAKGDVSRAQEKFDAQTTESRKKTTFADLLVRWAFADKNSLVSDSVRRFSISFMVDWISKGYTQYADNYRTEVSDAYSFNVDGCDVVCGENDLQTARETVSNYYQSTRFSSTIKDKFSLIYILMCVVGVATLGIMLAVGFNPVALTIGVLLVLAGVFLLWRRIVELLAIHREKERLSLQKLAHCLEELREWRNAYLDEDARHADLLQALKQFEQEGASV